MIKVDSSYRRWLPVLILLPLLGLTGCGEKAESDQSRMALT